MFCTVQSSSFVFNYKCYIFKKHWKMRLHSKQNNQDSLKIHQIISTQYHKSFSLCFLCPSLNLPWSFAILWVWTLAWLAVSIRFCQFPLPDRDWRMIHEELNRGLCSLYSTIVSICNIWQSYLSHFWFDLPVYLLYLITAGKYLFFSALRYSSKSFFPNSSLRRHQAPGKRQGCEL